MDIPSAPAPSICQQCQEQVDLDFDFTMAFQPIVDCSQRTLFGYEALVRGLNNEPCNDPLKSCSGHNEWRSQT